MYTLLLVEDDYQIRNGLSRFFPFAQVGFELVNSFENGKQAFAYLQSQPVDVLLTDIRMPVMDGLSLVEALIDAGQNPYVVAMSAFRDFDYAHRAISLGIHHYMVKTTRYDELIDIFAGLKEKLDQKRGPASSLALDKNIKIQTEDQTIQTIMAHVQGNLRDVSLSTAAAAVHMSPIYVSQLFKEKTGVHFIDYVISTKMQTAATLLSTGTQKLWDISDMVGYSNDKNFSRAFKKHFGISPNEYRKLESKHDAKSASSPFGF